MQLSERLSAPGLFDDANEVSGVHGVQPYFAEYTGIAVEQFAYLDIDRVEIFLYVAACAALCFGIWVVRRPFLGYLRIFEKMQSGKKAAYDGHTQISYLEGRSDWATFFPGLVFSTVLCGMAIVFFSLFFVLCVISTAGFWNFIWSLRTIIIWMLVTVVVQLVILKRLILDGLCIDNGDVVWPRTYACVYAIFVINNFALGALAAITRIICMIPFLFIQLSALDTCTLEEENVCWDIGYASFLVMTRHSYRATNPICRAFLQAVVPNANRLYGPKRKDGPVEKEDLEHGGLHPGEKKYLRPGRKHWAKAREHYFKGALKGPRET